MGRWGLLALLVLGFPSQSVDAQVSLGGQQISVGGSPVSTTVHRYVGPDYVDANYVGAAPEATPMNTPAASLDSRLLAVERAASLLGAFAGLDPAPPTRACQRPHDVGATLCRLSWRKTHGLRAIRAQLDDASQRLGERLFGRRMARFVSLSPDPKKLLEVRFRFQ